MENTRDLNATKGVILTVRPDTSGAIDLRGLMAILLDDEIGKGRGGDSLTVLRDRLTR